MCNIIAPPIHVDTIPKESVTDPPPPTDAHRLPTSPVDSNDPSPPPPHDAVNLAIDYNPPPADPDDAALKYSKKIKIRNANYLAVKKTQSQKEKGT